MQVFPYSIDSKSAACQQAVSHGWTCLSFNSASFNCLQANVRIHSSVKQTEQMSLHTPPVSTCCETESFEPFVHFFCENVLSAAQRPFTRLHAASLVFSSPHGSHLWKLPAIGKMCGTETLDRAELAGICRSSGGSSAKQHPAHSALTTSVNLYQLYTCIQRCCFVLWSLFNDLP